ncbi:uncharacterized protein K460DRAFT_418345 [Cucurbitaria berberidis CBS 394.84]|uniref:Uncharacterized protein n=1 Tax=Cucurbitaria berberidis CBS 394.84 TaxID=1168544 RepID=A0A9P4GCR4_9PLEO|nr:uncharacterized protein K460DRAFT_418345 [Cucurbitaria berberidis CBS 394.84]KAF1843242.1 hypothetical protein K460DRAFT_418345 [Cucurbitaria berberidis CBS 394.84]
MTEAEKKAYKKWNLCDTFCLLLHEVLEKHLQRKQAYLSSIFELNNNVNYPGYGATTDWIAVTPRPRITLVSGHVQPKVLLHSALFVCTKEGDQYAFDGTGEQFGWSSSSWLLDREDFWEQHAVAAKKWQWGDVNSETMRRMICAQDNGYWSLIIWSFDEMFESIGGVVLEKMSPVARVKYDGHTSETNTAVECFHFDQSHADTSPGCPDVIS